MRSSLVRSALTLVAPLALSVAAAPALRAQAPAAGALTAAPSGRATTTVTLARPRQAGQPAPAPQRISIDYGQPHARGRQVAGGLIPYGEVWRTGANDATTLRTDVDLMIGGTRVPAGTYTLFTHASPNGWQLAINRKTGQWGTEYDASQDLARVPLTTRTLREPVESFTMTLVPTPRTAEGTLRMAWGDTEASVPWRVAP